MIKIAVLFLIFGIGSLVCAIISTINIYRGDISIDPLSIFCFYLCSVAGFAVAGQITNKVIDEIIYTINDPTVPSEE